MGLPQGLVDARHVPDAEGDGVGIEGLGLEGQFLRIGLDEIDAPVISLLGPLAATLLRRPVIVSVARSGGS